MVHLWDPGATGNQGQHNPMKVGQAAGVHVTKAHDRSPQDILILWPWRDALLDIVHRHKLQTSSYLHVWEHDMSDAMPPSWYDIPGWEPGGPLQHAHSCQGQ